MLTVREGRRHDPRGQDAMNDLTVHRGTGASALALVVLCLGQLPLWMIAAPPSVYDGAAFGQHLLSIKNVAFTRILLDQACSSR